MRRIEKMLMEKRAQILLNLLECEVNAITCRFTSCCDRFAIMKTFVSYQMMLDEGKKLLYLDFDSIFRMIILKSVIDNMFIE